MSKYNKGKITRPDGKSSIEEYTGAEVESGLGAGTQQSTGGIGSGDSDRPPRSRLDSDQNPNIPDDRSTGITTSDGPFDEYGDLYGAGEAKDEKFFFFECDPVDINPDLKPCLICRPNPYAYVPDYRMMEDGEIFFDGKNCTQNIVLTFDAPANNFVDTATSPLDEFRPKIEKNISTGPTVSELKSGKFKNEQKEEGVRRLLNYFRKAQQATAFVYRPVPPKKRVKQGIDTNILTEANAPALALLSVESALLGTIVGLSSGKAIAEGYGANMPERRGYNLEAEDLDIKAELRPYAKYDFHIPLQLKARTRILISIPVEQFNRVPDKLDFPEEDEDESKTEVSFLGNDLVVMSKRAQSAFKVYNNELERWRGFEGGKLVEVKSGKTSAINLAKEAENIKAFVDQMRDLMDELGFSLDPFKPAKQPEKTVIKLNFENEKYSIKQIHVNLPGCPVVKIGPKGKYKDLFKKYIKKTPLNRQRTLYYIASLPEIDIALTAREPTPWLEVATKFTYPLIEVQYAANANTLFNDPTLLGCLINSNLQDERVDDFFNEVAGLLDNFPNMLLQQIGGTSCLTREELLKQIQDTEQYDNIWSRESRRVKAELQRKLRRDDPYLDIVVQEMFPAQTAWGNLTPAQQATEIKEHGSLKAAKEANAPEEKVEKFFVRLNDRLGRCGWIALLFKAIDCVSQNIVGEDATKLLAEEAFNTMDNTSLTRSFLGLPPEAQQKVVNSMRSNFGNISAPWETAYQPGSYSGADLPSSPLSGGSSAEDPEPADPDAGVNETPRPPSQRGSGGTYGRALGGVQQEAFDAMRQSMLSSLGADELLETMNSLPGAPIISSILKRLPCNQTPLIYSEPKLDSFLNTLEFDFCQWDADLTLPEFKTVKIIDLFMTLLEALKDAIIETAIAIAMKLIKLILEKIFSIACEALATLGASLLDLGNGNNHFKNLLQDNLCPDGTDVDVNNILTNLWGRLG